MAFMNAQPAAFVEIAASAESREVRSAEDHFGAAVVPLPFDLSVHDREDYFRAVLNPPPPSDELRRALAEYREFFSK